MKKVLTLILVLVMCCMALPFAGCSSGIFEDKYVDLPSERVGDYLTATYYYGTIKFPDLEKGYKMSVSIKEKVGDMEVEYVFNAKSQVVDNNLRVAGEIKMKGEDAFGHQLEGKFYYKDGVSYLDGKVDKDSGKYKIAGLYEMSISFVKGIITNGFLDVSTFNLAYENLKGLEGFNCLFGDGERDEFRRLRVVAKGESNIHEKDTQYNVEVTYMYTRYTWDALGIRCWMDLKQKATDFKYDTYNIRIEIEPNSEKVELGTYLDSYTEKSLFN